MKFAEGVWISEDAVQIHMEEWPGDTGLAELAHKFHWEAPLEKIEETDMVMTAFNRDKLGDDILNRVVVLACRHMVVTKNHKKSRCAICQAMIERGADYERYRGEQ